MANVDYPVIFGELNGLGWCEHFFRKRGAIDFEPSESSKSQVGWFCCGGCVFFKDMFSFYCWYTTPRNWNSSLLKMDGWKTFLLPSRGCRCSPTSVCDLTRVPHPNSGSIWKGNETPYVYLISGKSRLVKYYDLARFVTRWVVFVDFRRFFSSNTNGPKTHGVDCRVLAIKESENGSKHMANN